MLGILITLLLVVTIDATSLSLRRPNRWCNRFHQDGWIAFHYPLRFENTTTSVFRIATIGPEGLLIAATKNQCYPFSWQEAC